MDEQHVLVHPRITQRHPELSPEDVETAFKSQLDSFYRIQENQWVIIGLDANGRLIEIVAVIEGELIKIFHAMTPPSKKTLREIGLGGKR